jgi:hypothetical protein
VADERPGLHRGVRLGRPLLDEARAYLKEATELANVARAIAQAVHGGNSLSFPPPP